MIKTITKYVNNEGFSFTFEPIEDTLKIEKIKNGFEAQYLIQDLDPIDPFKDDEGLGDFFHWKDYGKEQLEKYYEALETEI